MIYLISGILLIIAFISAVNHSYIVAAYMLALVGIIDTVLIYFCGWLSISNWIRKLTPYSIDIIILIGSIPLVWILCGLPICVWFTLGLLTAHFFNVQNSRR